MPGKVQWPPHSHAPRARWLASSSSQQSALLPWVFVEWTHTVFERAARCTECVVWSACEEVGQQTMKAAGELLLIRRTPACTVVQTCGLRGDSSVGGRGDARVCAARRRGPSGAVLAMAKGGGRCGRTECRGRRGFISRVCAHPRKRKTVDHVPNWKRPAALSIWKRSGVGDGSSLVSKGGCASSPRDSVSNSS